ncbi:MAG: hypothetical protein E5W31_01740 [Mesorhizobium sp.]|nr:MAG: hypothetical protein E5W31_01740 [Mesorhizobium sp.]
MLLQLEQSSDALTHAIDEFLLDLMTVSFIVECYGRGFELLAGTLARRRLAKIRLLADGQFRQTEMTPKACWLKRRSRRVPHSEGN